MFNYQSILYCLSAKKKDHRQYSQECHIHPNGFTQEKHCFSKDFVFNHIFQSEQDFLSLFFVTAMNERTNFCLCR